MFVHLRLHSEYSVVDGIVRIDDAVKAAAASGQPALALTDFNNLFGAVKFYKAAQKKGLQPILGAEVLLEDLLAQEGLTGQHIAGFERDETSHTAVAQAVVSGAADTGLGIEMVARARGLDFVPLVDERYHLACLKATLEQPATRALRELLLTRVWQDHLASLPGYSPMHSGQVLAMSNVLPWWDFTRPKRPSAHRKKP